MEIRLDRGVISKSEITEEGYLRVWMTVSKVGDLEYRNDNGTVRKEHVPESTLYDQESLSTVWGKPITFDHPDIGLLDSSNTSKYMKGLTQQGMFLADGFLTVVGVVTDKVTIDAIQSGTTQVSAGYKTKVIPKLDGTFEQVNRRYNHFAIVPRGRAGADVKVHFDCYRCDAVDSIENKEKPMATINLDGVGYEVEGSVASAIALERQRHDSQLKDLQVKKDSLENQLSTIQAELDKTKGELDATKIKLEESTKTDSFDSEIASRMDAWREVLPSIERVDNEFSPNYGESVAGIKRVYLAKVHQRADLADKSDAYIEGLYEALKPDPANTAREDAIAKTTKTLSNLKNLDGNSYKKKDEEMMARRKSRPLPGFDA